MPAFVLGRSYSLPAMPQYNRPAPLPEPAMTTLSRQDYQPAMPEPSVMRHKLLAAMALASGKTEKAFSAKQLLADIRGYRERLEERHDSGHSAYVFLNTRLDENQSESFLKHIVALENWRKPDLNLGICRGTAEFSAYLAQRRDSAPAETVERTAVMHLVNGFHHVILYETTFLKDRMYIRGFDPLPKKVANKYFVALCADLRKIATGEQPVKLDGHAQSQQFSGESCDLFAISAACVSLAERQNAGSTFVIPDQTAGCDADFALHDAGTEPRLSPDYFRHSQSLSSLKRLLSLYQAKGNVSAVRQQKDVIERHKSLRHEQIAYLDNQDEFVSMPVATSIIQNRIDHLTDIETELAGLIAGDADEDKTPAVASPAAARFPVTLRRRSIS